MARLSWNQDVNKKYELGLDQGVLYLEDTVVPWNGLVDVTQIPVNDSVSSYYFDGVKYFDKKQETIYQMNVTALTFPDEFLEVIGHQPLVPGFFLTSQEKKKFGLSYRTQIGDGLGYKLHLVYNAIVKTTSIKHTTIKDVTDIQTQSFIVDTVPLPYDGRNPSSYIVFDSTNADPEAFTFLEHILYGSEESLPRLPNIFELSNIFEYWKPFKVEYDSSGFSTLFPEFGDLFKTRIDGLFLHNQLERLKVTSTPGIYRLEP